MGCGASTQAPPGDTSIVPAPASAPAARRSETEVDDQTAAMGMEAVPKVARSNSVTDVYTGDKWQQELDALKAQQKPEDQSDDEGAALTLADAGALPAAEGEGLSLADQMMADMAAGRAARAAEEAAAAPAELSLADQIKADIAAGKAAAEAEAAIEGAAAVVELSLADQIKADIAAGKAAAEAEAAIEGAAAVVELSLADQIKADIAAGKAAAAAAEAAGEPPADE